MSASDPVADSLEQLAEIGEDVTPEVYHRFAERCPDAALLMDHTDDYMRGRMMQDVLVLLMTPPEEIDHNYLSFEVTSHRAYGVTPDMFPPLLACVRDTLATRLDGAWTPEIEAAWNRRIDRLAAEIEQAAASA